MMNTPETTTDRRRRRSDEPHQAIGHQLARVVKDFRLDCCLIVDQTGQVVASSHQRSQEFVDAFASLLPLMSDHPEHEPRYLDQLRRFDDALDEREITSCVFRAGGRRLFIGATGPEAVMNEVAIFRAITGTRRISTRRGVGGKGAWGNGTATT